MWRIGMIVVAACGSTTTPQVAANRAPDPAPTKKTYVQQHLTVAGGDHPSTTRSTWVLTIDGARASLVATFEEATSPVGLDGVDHATWKVTETRKDAGPVRTVGDHLALDLATPTDSLFLHCWKRSVAVAAAGARRVHQAGHDKDCDDGGTWSPAATSHVDALICSQGETLEDGDYLDEALFQFAEAPGVELVQIAEPCFNTSGFRLAKPR